MSRYVLPLSVLGTAVGGAVLLKDFVAGGACPSKATIPGKTVIVTGANTGIGKQTALELAKRGGNIILACRDMEKCEAAAKEIRGETLNHRVNARHLDLASLKSIREFAAKVTEEEEHVHILINNAAVMRCPHWTTEDGFEMQLGVNYLGHFLLTNLLLDKLKASAPSRIINVSSLAHVAGHIDFEDLNWEKRKYDTKAAYCQSKLAVVVSTKELSRRLQGTGVTVNALHPGVARTELGRHTGMHSSAFSSFTLESPYCTEELVFQATSRTDPHCSPSNSQAGSFPAEPSGKPCGRKAGLCGGPVSHLRGRKITAGNPQCFAGTKGFGHRPTYLKSTKTLLKKDPLPSCLGLLPSSSSRSSSSSSFSSACAAVEANRVPLIMRPRANRILTAPTLAWTSQKKIRTMSQCTSHQRRTGRGTCRSTPRNAHGALLSPPLSRTRIPSWRVRFHSHLAALRTPQYSPAWTRLHFIQRAEVELAVCPPWHKGPLRSVRTLLPLVHLGSPSPHFGAPRRLKNTEALSVVKKFWDMRDGTFPAVSVNKGYHSHGR